MTNPAAVTTPIVSSPTVGNSPRVQPRERAEEDAVAGRVVRHPGAAEQAGEDGGERGDEDEDGDDLRRGVPQVRSSTSEATDGKAGEFWSSISCQLTTPRMPICMAR